MNRRNFLRSAAIASAGLAFPHTDHLFARKEGSGNWRTFEVTTHVEILNASGATRIWLPAGLGIKTPFQTTLSNNFVAQGGSARLIRSPVAGLGVIAAEFPSGVRPVLTLATRVATKDYATDLS